MKTKTFDIIVYSNHNHPNKTKTVTAHHTKGEFGVYDTEKAGISSLKKWGISHIPTGAKVKECKTLAEVNDLLGKIVHIKIKDLDDEKNISKLGKIIVPLLRSESGI